MHNVHKADNIKIDSSFLYRQSKHDSWVLQPVV
jgi:hypothetical protein